MRRARRRAVGAPIRDVLAPQVSSRHREDERNVSSGVGGHHRCELADQDRSWPGVGTGKNTSTARESVWRRWVIAVLASGVAFALSLAPAQGATRKIEIHAVYNAPKCPSGTALTPIPRAKLTVTIGSQTIRRVLDERGTAELEVSSTAKEARAKVTLDGNVLEIDPYGASTPYSFTEELRLAGHNTFTVEPQQLEDRGALSAWSILSLGTELGRTSMPAGVSLPKVTARYDPGRGPTGGLPDVPGHNTAYDSGTREILIDSISFADEFEPWVLLHEYGHHVLGTVADPGPDSGGA